MADEVEISNVGGENGVASEATLASLLRAMERMSGAAGSNSSDAARAARRLREALRDAAGSTEDNTDALDENTESIESAGEATGRFTRAIVNVTGNLIGVLSSSIVGLGGVLLSSTTQLSDFAEQIPFIGGILGSLVGILDDSIATFRQLSSVGAAFGNSIEDMRLSATQLELGLDEMASFVSSNSEALRLLSGTVTDGVNRFKAINKTIKDTGDFAALKNLGFTVEEINEGMADYTALQARLGRLQRMDSRQIANGSARYLEQLDRLAKVTGQSRKELAASMLQQSEDAAFRALQNNLSGEALINFRSSMALIDTLPESVAAGLRDLADGIPQTAEGIALLTTIGPEIQSAMTEIAKGADPQVLIEAIGAAGHDIENFIGGSAKEQAAIISQLRQTQPEIAAVLDAATKMKNFGTKEMSAARAEQAKRAETTATLTEFDDTLRTFRATIAKAFIKSGIFEKMAGGVASVADLLEKTLASDEFAASLKNISSKIKEFLADIQGAGIKEAFKNLFKEDGPFAGLGSMISDVIKSALKETLPMIGVGLVALFGGVYLAKKIGGAFTGLLGNLFGGGGGGDDDDGPDRGDRRGGRRGGGVGRGLASAGVGAGKGLAGIGKGIGKGLGGILKGLATGIAAFANPAVAAGAVVISGVIVAIGAAIAGAAWLTGKALPTFAEGMKSFEEVNGEKLKTAGAGMLSVAGGLAAFGGASIVAGVGNIAGFVGELFGGSALENMKETAKGMQAIADVKGLKSNLEVLNRGLDTDSIKNYADAMERLVEALSEMNEELSKDNKIGFGKGTNAGDVLNKANTATSGSTEGIKELNNLMQQVLMTLQRMQVDTNKTERNTKNLGGGNIANGYVSSIR